MSDSPGSGGNCAPIARVLDAITFGVAVIERDGTVLATNSTWERFIDASGPELASVRAGGNYLAFLRRLAGCGNPFAAAFQRGALRVTADTGSPIDVIGMLSPSFAGVQSASVIVLEPEGACAPAPADQIRAAAPAPIAIHARE